MNYEWFRLRSIIPAQQAANSFPRLDVSQERQPINRCFASAGDAVDGGAIRHDVFEPCLLPRLRPRLQNIDSTTEQTGRRSERHSSPITRSRDNVEIAGDAAGG